MEHECSACGGIGQTVDRVAGARPVRIPGRGQDDRHGRSGERRQPPVDQGRTRPHGVQVTAGRRQQDRAERAGQSRQDGLRLRIAEPRIAFEQDRPVGGQHEARIQRATERRPAAGQLSEDRLVEVGQQRRSAGIGQVRQRAVGTHPAGVGPTVVIEQTLVVAGHRERDRGSAIAQGDEAGLGPLQPLLDHDPWVPAFVAGPVAVGQRAREGVDRRLGVLDRIADGHALAGRETVRLHDDPSPVGCQALARTPWPRSGR